MKNFFDGYENYTEEQKVEMLENMADGKEITTFYKPLSESEISSKRETLSQEMSKRRRILKEAKSVADDYKEQVKRCNNVVDEALEAIERRAEEKNGVLYKIIDHKTKTVNYYDNNGAWINGRRMNPEEQQLSIMSVSRGGAMLSVDEEETD